MIIAILSAAIAPVFVGASEKARQAACLSNEKRIGLALMQYAQDHDGMLMAQKAGTNAPTSPKWMDLVFPYIKSEAAFTCPDADPADAMARYLYVTKRAGRRFGSYGVNDSYYKGSGVPGVSATAPLNPLTGTPLSKIAAPATTVFATEMRTGLPFSGSPANATVDWANAAQNPVLDAASVPPTLVPKTRTDPVVLLRHSGGVNVLWCDGHARWVAGADLIATHEVGKAQIAYLWTIEDD